jgi:hypothetical protein
MTDDLTCACRMGTEKGSFTVAKTIGDIEVERIVGPGDAKNVKMSSFWQDQVCTSFLHFQKQRNFPLTLKSASCPPNQMCFKSCTSAWICPFFVYLLSRIIRFIRQSDHKD